MHKFMLLAGLCLAAISPAVSQQSPSRDKAVAALHHAQQAAGGVDRLLEIRDITRRVDMVLDQTGTKASQTVEVILPATIKLSSRVDDDQEVVAYYDGISGWIQAEVGGEKVLPDWQRDAAQQEVLRQPEVVLLSDRDKQTTLEYVKSEMIDGKTADVVDIIARVGGKVTLAIDSASGDVLRMQYPRISPHGTRFHVTDFYSDFRRTKNGLRLPFKIRTLQDDKPYMQAAVTSVEYNKGLRAGMLDRKTATGIE